MRVRVYKLARELNMDSKDLLDLCRQVGIDVKNQLSSILGDRLGALAPGLKMTPSALHEICQKIDIDMDVSAKAPPVSMNHPPDSQSGRKSGQTLEKTCPNPKCSITLRLQNIPINNPQLRGKCPTCEHQWIMVASRTLYTRRTEPPWLGRKLSNAERFAKIEDARDIVYSELFIAFEVLLRLLHGCIGHGGDLYSRVMIEDLSRAGVIRRDLRQKMHDAVTSRNRLFHGEAVDIERLPVEDLQLVINDLRWYFVSAPA